MTIHVADPWHAPLDRALYPTLFLSRDEVKSATPQAHLLRHAFDVLDLNQIFCTDGAPLIFFKYLDSFEREQTLDLHRRFWNHGGAPLLTLVSKDRAEIYSGTSRPVSPEDAGAASRSLITTLDLLGTALPQFLISVESGEFFRSHARLFNPIPRIDRDLLASLGAIRDCHPQLYHDGRRTPTEGEGRPDGRGAGPVRVTVEGSLTELLGHASHDRMIQRRGSALTTLNLPNRTFTYYVDIAALRFGRLDTTYADSPS